MLYKFMPGVEQSPVQGDHQMIQLQYSTRLQRMLRLDVRQIRALAKSLDYVPPQTIRFPAKRAAECITRLRKLHFRAQVYRYTCAVYSNIVREITLGRQKGGKGLTGRQEILEELTIISRKLPAHECRMPDSVTEGHENV
jgi:hypothetical protein